MSILIKGLEMPFKNEITLLTIYPDGTVRQQTGYVHVVTDCICPNAAIEIPKHGKLIDADELLEKQFEEEHTHDYIVYADDVDDAPTIIEGEEE